MADADLTLVVVDLSAPPMQTPTATWPSAPSRQGRCLLVGNKCDLRRAAGPARSRLPARFRAHRRGHSEPARRHSGRRGAREGAFEQETGFITSLRHERLLRESPNPWSRPRRGAEAAIPHEMLLLDLYAALRPIDAITGATTADDILNRIFSTFCIGK